MARRAPKTNPHYTKLHEVFVSGARSGQEDVPLAVGCNPPLPYDTPPSEAEKARRMAAMGNLTPQPASPASRGLSREDRLRALNSDASSRPEDRKRLHKMILDDAASTRGF